MYATFLLHSPHLPKECDGRVSFLFVCHSPLYRFPHLASPVAEPIDVAFQTFSNSLPILLKSLWDRVLRCIRSPPSLFRSNYSTSASMQAPTSIPVQFSRLCLFHSYSLAINATFNTNILPIQRSTPAYSICLPSQLSPSLSIAQLYYPISSAIQTFLVIHATGSNLENSIFYICCCVPYNTIRIHIFSCSAQGRDERNHHPNS